MEFLQQKDPSLKGGKEALTALQHQMQELSPRTLGWPNLAKQVRRHSHKGQSTGPKCRSSASRSHTTMVSSTPSILQWKGSSKITTTTMTCPSVVFAFVTLGTALPATSMVTTPGFAAKPSGQLTVDPAKTGQQFPYMPVGTPFHDHWNLSMLGGYGGLGSSVTCSWASICI